MHAEKVRVKASLNYGMIGQAKIRMARINQILAYPIIRQLRDTFPRTFLVYIDHFIRSFRIQLDYSLIYQEGGCCTYNPWSNFLFILASTFLVYQVITELFSKGTSKVINVCQKSPSEDISQVWDDWIGQDSNGSYQSNLGLSNHPIVERCLNSDFFDMHGSLYSLFSKTTQLQLDILGRWMLR